MRSAFALLAIAPGSTAVNIDIQGLQFEQVTCPGDVAGSMSEQTCSGTTDGDFTVLAGDQLIGHKRWTANAHIAPAANAALAKGVKDATECASLCKACDTGTNGMCVMDAAQKARGCKFSVYYFNSHLCEGYGYCGTLIDVHTHLQDTGKFGGKAFAALCGSTDTPTDAPTPSTNEIGNSKGTVRTKVPTIGFNQAPVNDVGCMPWQPCWGKTGGGGAKKSNAPTTEAPTTEAPTTEAPTTEAPTTFAPTTLAPATAEPTEFITTNPTTQAPTTQTPTTEAPTTEAPTTEAPTTEAPTTLAPTTMPPTTLNPTASNQCGWQELCNGCDYDGPEKPVALSKGATWEIGLAECQFACGEDKTCSGIDFGRKGSKSEGSCFLNTGSSRRYVRSTGYDAYVYRACTEKPTKEQLPNAAGDPFTTYQGKTSQFWATPGVDFDMMHCHAWTLRSSVFNANGENQWFKDIKLLRRGEVVMNFTVAPTVMMLNGTALPDKETTAENPATLKVQTSKWAMSAVGDLQSMRGGGAPMLRGEHTPRYEIRAAVTANGKHKGFHTVTVSAGEEDKPHLSFEISTAPAVKMVKVSDRLRFTHLDLAFTAEFDAQASGCTGLLPEIWGVQPLSATTAKMLIPPTTSEKTAEDGADE